jgi:hypothetical protein
MLSIVKYFLLQLDGSALYCASPAVSGNVPPVFNGAVTNAV